MDRNRNAWNERQKELRLALAEPDAHPQVVELFLSQHAMVHAGVISRSPAPTFEDQVWDGLQPAAARCIPPSCEHSIAWCFWHLSRIEDVAMNMLLAGSPQLLFHAGWFARLNVPYLDTGNGMPPVDVARLGTEIDLGALRLYRQAVGLRTREIVTRLKLEDLKKKVDPARLAWVLADGAVSEAGGEVIDYWGKLNGAGLLLMPATRHALLHLNEMARIRKKCN